MTSAKSPTAQGPTGLHAALDKIYLFSGYAAALCLSLILVIIILQIILRYLGLNSGGLPTYAGYMMAASTFLGLPYALVSGSHIRIETISKLAGSWRKTLDLVAFFMGMVIAAWFAYYACNMAYTSWKLDDISPELDATPLWIPHATMAIGATLFAVAMADIFATLLLTGKYRLQSNLSSHP